MVAAASCRDLPVPLQCGLALMVWNQMLSVSGSKNDELALALLPSGLMNLMVLVAPPPEMPQVTRLAAS